LGLATLCANSIVLRCAALLPQTIHGKDRIHILARAGKLGLGSAYTDGLKVITGTHVILMDADLSHHPKFIPALIAKQQQGNYDVITGTRYAMGGGVSSRNTL
jgi:dolichol-phosphate mannosyltransferase